METAHVSFAVFQKTIGVERMAAVLSAGTFRHRFHRHFGPTVSERKGLPHVISGCPRRRDPAASRPFRPDIPLDCCQGAIIGDSTAAVAAESPSCGLPSSLHPTSLSEHLVQSVPSSVWSLQWVCIASACVNIVPGYEFAACLNTIGYSFYFIARYDDGHSDDADSMSTKRT